MNYITWKHLATELRADSPIEKKIEIFDHRVWGWQLHVAELLVNGGDHHDGLKKAEEIPHAGFATLLILLSYFEMIARYETGNTGEDQSRDVFVNGFLSVFPEVKNYPYMATRHFLNALYKEVRCGLYHMSIPGRGVAIARQKTAIAYNPDTRQIVIDPHQLPAALTNHFKNYVARLRDSTQGELRKAFEKRFKHDYGV